MLEQLEQSSAPSYSYEACLQVSERINWRVEDLIGGDKRLDFSRAFLPEALEVNPLLARSAIASTFAASLEMAKKGELELRQGANFGPIYVRRSRAPAPTSQ